MDINFAMFVQLLYIKKKKNRLVLNVLESNNIFQSKYTGCVINIKKAIKVLKLKMLRA